MTRSNYTTENRLLFIPSLLCALLLVLGPVALSHAEPNALKIPTWKVLLSSTSQSEENFAKALTEAQTSRQIDRYPEQDVLTERAFFRLNTGNLGGAEADYRSALRLAENSLDVLWTKTIAPAERNYYLPAYTDTAQERTGKLHHIANLRRWLAETKFQQGDLNGAQEHLDHCFQIIGSKLPINGATIIEISAEELQARIHEKRGNADKAKAWREKASTKRRGLLE